jgi:hypothetical protein
MDTKLAARRDKANADVAECIQVLLGFDARIGVQDIGFEQVSFSRRVDIQHGNKRNTADGCEANVVAEADFHSGSGRDLQNGRSTVRVKLVLSRDISRRFERRTQRKQPLLQGSSAKEEKIRRQRGELEIRYDTALVKTDSIVMIVYDVRRFKEFLSSKKRGFT